MRTIRNYVSAVIESKAKIETAYTGLENRTVPIEHVTLLLRLRPFLPDRVIVGSLPVRFYYPEKTLKGVLYIT
jgi:hypothetical protein